MQVRHLISLKRTGPKKGDRPALRMALHVSNCTGHAQGVPFDVRRQRFFWLDDGPLHVYRDPFTQRTREEGRRHRGLLKEHHVPMAWFLTALWNKMMAFRFLSKNRSYFFSTLRTGVRLAEHTHCLTLSQPNVVGAFGCSFSLTMEHSTRKGRRMTEMMSTRR